jgi:hypothetical protein
VRTILAAGLLIGGCALLQPPLTNVDAPLRQGKVLSAAAAANTVTIGRSTKADVRTALGEAMVIDFESGYEVWVYRERLREKATLSATEFVLLFAPSGIVTKTRIR